MSEEKISRSIIEEAEKKAEILMNEASEKALEIKEKGRLEIEKVKKYQEDMIKQLSEREKEKHVSLAQLEISLEKLRARRKAMDQVFEEVLRKTLIRDEGYKERLKKAILAGAKTGNETIHVCAEDIKILDAAFIKKLNDGFPGKGGFKISNEPVKITGGAVLKEGKVLTDASFKTILDEEKYFLETEISKMISETGS